MTSSSLPLVLVSRGKRGFVPTKKKQLGGERKEGSICLVNQIGGGVVGCGVVLGCVERGVFSFFLIVTILVEFWKESENYLLTLMLSHLVSTYKSHVVSSTKIYLLSKNKICHPNPSLPVIPAFRKSCW